MNGTTCVESAASGPLRNLTSIQLDFYACLNELDHAVGRVLDALDSHGYGENTLAWLATDDGPEKNCQPEGICDQAHYANDGPGVADPLRGRKRDIWEGGHRIPSVISWPAVVKGDAGRVSWEQVVTHDFLATIMDVLNVSRPVHQVRLVACTPTPTCCRRCSDVLNRTKSDRWAFRHNLCTLIASTTSVSLLWRSRGSASTTTLVSCSGFALHRPTGVSMAGQFCHC